ncbi:hypothetical protein [Paenibacillus aceris]|uniref:Membrane protein YccC n=1 Tax=Paenibacillus aceris TaxID=869555 RepID=A0ABS4I173_9BACL|nr:hypothetical protein [Paenibacillus aceris]MBP1964176.1 putative membrane protein YccC [Paenibacillus aceris]NHW36504.1 hypothetical protein [Paenibacillus aceris]
MKNSIFGLVASIGCIILCAVFLYGNPYSSTPPDSGTKNVFYTMLILPACVGIVASFLKNRILMFIVFIWSLPYGLYLTVVSIPSIWNLFGVVLLVYFVTTMKMKKAAVT